jgi:hypothetical protein
LPVASASRARAELRPGPLPDYPRSGPSG